MCLLERDVNPKLEFICLPRVEAVLARAPGGGGEVPPYMGYIGMCGAKGYGFSAILVINRVSLLAILVINRV